MNENSGIYKIHNIKTEKFYIGSSKRLKERKSDHFVALRNGRHANKKLLSSFNKHGEDSFKFEIVELCEVEDLLSLEQDYLDKLNPYYNLSKKALGGGSLKLNRRTLTSEQIVEIFYNFSIGVNCKELRVNYKLTQPTLHNLLRRKTYSDVKIEDDVLTKVNYILRTSTFNSADVGFIFRLYALGFSSEEIGSLYKVDRDTISRIASRSGSYKNVFIPDHIEKKVLEIYKSRTKRISEEEFALIKERHKTTPSKKKLGEEFGYCKNTILAAFKKYDKKDNK